MLPILNYGNVVALRNLVTVVVVVPEVSGQTQLIARTALSGMSLNPGDNIIVASVGRSAELFVIARLESLPVDYGPEIPGPPAGDG